MGVSLTFPREIPLTQGKVALVDDEDYERVSQRKWWRWANGYAAAYIDGKVIPLHRFILNAKKGDEIDHINTNKLDCRRANLRLCTRSQNVMNTRLRADNTTGFKGISYIKKKRGTKKYSAHLKIGTRRIHLGYFYAPVEAARAYDKAAREHFGEFARLNFPEESD